MTDKTYTTFVFAPSGSGTSLLDSLLKSNGVPIVAGPVLTDGPKEFAEAERAAHDMEACLPNLHDTILDATGMSLSDCDLRQLLAQLPEEIREQVDDWGLADTDVREQIYDHIRQHGLYPERIFVLSKTEIEQRLAVNTKKLSALEVEQAILELLLMNQTNSDRAIKVAQAVPAMIAAI